MRVVVLDAGTLVLRGSVSQSGSVLMGATSLVGPSCSQAVGHSRIRTDPTGGGELSELGRLAEAPCGGRTITTVSADGPASLAPTEKTTGAEVSPDARWPAFPMSDHAIRGGCGCPAVTEVTPMQ